MRRLVILIAFAFVVGGAALAGAQDQSGIVETGASPCATSMASPGASPDVGLTATPGSVDGLPVASPEASPADLRQCATPGAGTPAP